LLHRRSPVGAKSSAYGYGYKYKYGAIDKDRTEIVMFAHQPDSGSVNEG
jgi:hypothetical protein